MDDTQFLAEFGHIANSPGGVERLKELVLHLGVTGALLDNFSGLSAHDLYIETWIQI